MVFNFVCVKKVMEPINKDYAKSVKFHIVQFVIAQIKFSALYVAKVSIYQKI